MWEASDAASPRPRGRGHVLRWMVGEPGQQPGPAAIGTWMPAASIVAPPGRGCRRGGGARRGLFERRARVALGATRAAPPSGWRRAAITGPRASIQSSTRSATSSRLDDPRWPAPRRSWIAPRPAQQQHRSYGSRQRTRSCAAIAASHSVVKTASPRATCSGSSGGTSRVPGARVAPARGQVAAAGHVAGKSKRHAVSTLAGLIGGGGQPRTGAEATTPERGATRTAPSRPPADSALSICVTGQASFRALTEGHLRPGPGRHA